MCLIENDPGLEIGSPYTKREVYIQDMYRYFRWTRNNLADIKLGNYLNDVEKAEYLCRCIDLSREIKEHDSKSKV